MEIARKSVEPIAAKTAPGRTAAKHQSLLHFIGIGERSDESAGETVRDGAASP
jgi:SRSO17 transposase